MHNPEYRHELKFIIGKQEADLLKKQLSFFCKLDRFSVSDDYSYDIRSLYFDDVMNSGYTDKINGEEYRKKYRIRIYNNSSSVIKLECKHKDDDMTLKDECLIDLETAKALIDGNYKDVKADSALLQQFLIDARLYGLKPSTIVEYRRLAYAYPVSKTRITFDENIRSAKPSQEFFSPTLKTLPIEGNEQIELEVKCNEFLPQHIQILLNEIPKCRVAMSKYALSYEVNE